MPTGKRLVKNTLTLFTCQAGMLFLSSIFIVYLARLLGPQDYGKYVFAVNFPLIFFVVMDFLTELSVRDVARDKSNANAYLSNTIALKALLFPLLFLVIYVSLYIMGYPQDTVIAVCVLSLFVFLQKLSASFSAIYVANEKLGYSAISGLVEKLIIVSLALPILFSGGELTTFVWAFVVAGLIRLCALAALIGKYAQLRSKIDTALWKYLFQAGYPVLAYTLFIMLLSKIGIVFLSRIKGDQAVGMYGIGYSLFMVVAIIATSFSSSLYPLFSKYAQAAREKAASLYAIAFKLLFASAVLIVVGVLTLSDKVILLLFKQAYIDSVPVLKIIFLALPLFFVRNILYTILFSVNRQKQVMWVFSVSLLCNVILCIVLIPRLSSIGAGIAFVISELLVFSMLFYLTTRYFSKLNLLNIVGKTILAGVIMYLFLFYLRELHLLLAASAGTAIFIGLLFLEKLLSKEQIKTVTQSIFSQS